MARIISSLIWPKAITIPSLSRRTVITFVLLFGLMTIVAAFSLKPNTYAEQAITALEEEVELFNLSNNQRITRGLLPLSWNNGLYTAAQLKIDHMVVLGYFDHIAPDGTTPWQFFDEAGYVYAVAGENLAIDFEDTSQAMEAWMHSASHRENVLDRDFNDIAIAVREVVFNNRKTTIIVQLFGTQAQAIDKVGDMLVDKTSLLLK